MTDQTRIASQVAIKLAGSPVQQAAMDKLAGITVDQHTHLPNMFTLRFYDPELSLLDNGPFDLTKEVEILAETNNGKKVSLIKGDITALEPCFNEGMVAELVVRGYDRSHRLYRETKSRAFLNVKDSDLAQKIAVEGGLTPQVDTTNAVYDHLFQHNQSNLAFLFQRAWRIGFECFVAEGKLHFRKPPTGNASVKLKWGEDLKTFHPRMTLAEQVNEVNVRGWDAEKQSAILGKAQTGNLYPEVQESRKGAEWARSFGEGKLVIVDQPVISQAEAEALATARLDEISGTFIEAEGLASRRPDIRAGQMVEIEQLGRRFSGTYLVTSSIHIFSPEGLRTEFSVRGTRTGMLIEQVLHQEPRERWPGVVIAVVTDTNDPNKLGRVKVKYPWLTDNAESGWIRVVSNGAGPKAGFFNIPGINDEVLVAFEHGEFNHPYVIGGLWSGKNELPKESADTPGTEIPLLRTWHSREGHRITLSDRPGKKKIDITTNDGRSITLSDQDRMITVKTSGVTFSCDDQKASLDAKGEISIKTTGNIKLDATNIDIDAKGQVNIKGTMVNLN
jgi:phage protein D/phage baseplate assembly protein gpV